MVNIIRLTVETFLTHITCCLGSCPTETEPVPPELQPLIAADNEDGSEVNATDPIVQLFLKRQRRLKEVKKRREAGVLERLARFSVKKYYTIRRG